MKIVIKNDGNRYRIAAISPAVTFIELIVALFIICLLLAVAIPAVIYARSSMARVNCAANLRQIGILLTSYSADCGVLPLGRVSRFQDINDLLGEQGKPSMLLLSKSNASPESAWSVALLSRLEQSFASQYNVDVGVLGYFDLADPMFIKGLSENVKLFQEISPTFMCPSDNLSRYPLPRIIGGGSWKLARGNYAACWGNTNWNQSSDLNGDSLPERTARFYPSAFGTLPVSFDDFRDGLSKTMVISEVVGGTEIDLRGVIWFPAPGASIFMTRLAPNGVIDLLGFSGDGDGLPFRMCRSSATQPCFGARIPGLSYAGARSRHDGGVNVLFGDGSVSFVSNAIDSSIWRSYGSVSGDE